MSVKKSSTQNSGHEGIKCHQPNFFQTSSDMSSWISESFINLGQFLDMEMNFWRKLVPSKRRTKIARFSINFFAYAKFSGRRSWSWVFKFFLGKLRYVMMNFWKFQVPMTILSTFSEFLKIKKRRTIFSYFVGLQQNSNATDITISVVSSGGHLGTSLKIAPYIYRNATVFKLRLMTKYITCSSHTFS